MGDFFRRFEANLPGGKFHRWHLIYILANAFDFAIHLWMLYMTRHGTTFMGSVLLMPSTLPFASLGFMTISLTFINPKRFAENGDKPPWPARIDLGLMIASQGCDLAAIGTAWSDSSVELLARTVLTWLCFAPKAVKVYQIRTARQEQQKLKQ